MRQGPSDEQPSLPAAAAYGLFQFPLGLMIPPLTLMLPGFFSETMGVKLAAVGAIAGTVRLMHLVTDPLTGALSDRTGGRFGRRRPWILAGVCLALIGVFLLFAPPVAKATPAYLAAGLMLVYLSTSLIQIPYVAWGAEYPATPFGRARMLGLREVAGLTGMLLSGMAPLVAAALHRPANGRAAMGGLALALMVLLPAAAVLLLRSPEPHAAPRPREPLRPAATLRAFWSAFSANPAYRVQLAGAQTVNIGIAVGQSVSYFFLSRILMLPQMFGVLLLFGGLCAVLSAPFWVWLSRRVELRLLVGGAVIAAAFVHMIGFSLLRPGQPLPLLLVEIVQAVLIAPAVILSPNLQARAVEQGALDSGVDRAGVYVSMDQLFGQVANAAPFILLFPLLAAAGFEPSAKAIGAEGLHALRLAGIFAAAPFQILGGLIITRFPIDRARAAENAAKTAALAAARHAA